MHRSHLVAALAALVPLGNAQAGAPNQAPIATQTSVIWIDVIPAVSTSIVYQTAVYTLLQCPPDVTNCPVRQHSIAVITATTGVTTTICPLTMTQARLSSFSTTVAPSQITGGEISRTTSTWPTQYSVLSSYSLPSDYSIDPTVWSSDFPDGIPASTSEVSSSGAFAAASASATSFDPSMATALSLFKNAPFDTVVSVHNSISTIPADPSYSTSYTIGSFAGIIGSNSTVSITTYGAATLDYTSASAAATLTAYGSNGTGFSSSAGTAAGTAAGTISSGAYSSNATSSGFATGTAVSNATLTGPPITFQTINVGPALPVNFFSLLIAILAVAFAP